MRFIYENNDKSHKCGLSPTMFAGGSNRLLGNAVRAPPSNAYKSHLPLTGQIHWNTLENK